MILITDVVGMVGVVLVLVAYQLLQTGKLPADKPTYYWINLSGSVLILFSLFFTWNLASVIIEIAWIVISVLGIVRTSRRA